KKLLKSGLVEKEKEFFWSKKGKKIIMYKVSNKSVIISPKKEINSKLKSLIPAVLLTGASTFAIYTYEKIKGAQNLVERGIDITTPSLANKFYEVGISKEVAQTVTLDAIKNTSTPLWFWFLLGALITIIIFSILNWKKL
ncbi:MAG: hypothetical protein OQK82_02860, partial [Candidatus Pacearchaeota archaeon]|nr:hypothetical protein [Candidatus Pacearchaeota archaeon]